MNANPGAARPNCALRYHPDGFRIDGTAVMGRQSAGAGFVKGFIEHGGADRLVALADSRRHFEDFRTLAGDARPHRATWDSAARRITASGRSTAKGV